GPLASLIYSASSKPVDARSSISHLDDHLCLSFATHGDRWYYGYSMRIGGEMGGGYSVPVSNKVWPAKGRQCAADSFPGAKHLALVDALATLQWWLNGCSTRPSDNAQKGRIERLMSIVKSGKHQLVISCAEAGNEID